MSNTEIHTIQSRQITSKKLVIIDIHEYTLSRLQDALNYDVMFDYLLRRPHLFNINDMLDNLDDESKPEFRRYVESLHSEHGGDTYVAFIPTCYCNIS